MANGLKSLREQRDWTIEDAANAMGLSYGGYEKIERGERRLSQDHIARARSIYGASSDEVTGDAPIAPRHERMDNRGEAPVRALIALLSGTYEASGVESALARELASAAVAAAYSPIGDQSHLTDEDWRESGRRLIRLLAPKAPQ